MQTYLQLANTKAEKERQKLIAIEPVIRWNLSHHGFSYNEVHVIIRYIRQTIRKGKELDVDTLLSLLGQVEGNKVHEQHERLVEFIIKIVHVERGYQLIELNKWISDNGIPDNMKKEIMLNVRLRLQEGKNVDVVNIIGVLPPSLAQSVTEHLCWNTLKKVPIIKTEYEMVCKYLKPVTYSENTYIIRKGEPLDMHKALRGASTRHQWKVFKDVITSEMNF